MKLVSLTTLLFLLFSITTWAQESDLDDESVVFDTPVNGKITGRLEYRQDGAATPLPFASVALFQSSDSSAVAGVISDEKGYFELLNLPLGHYYLLVQSLGFDTFQKSDIFLTAQKPQLSLGTLTLEESATQLEAVNVTGQRELMEYALDRKIVNVDKLPTTLGGTAIDIMQNVPSVTVDVDGNLSLRGSENVIILINGKPSGLTGLDRQAVLEQIPASNIERVEIITNPSSRFDADGAAGIINIVLKQERAAGFNGNAQFTAGTRDKYNASVNLNNRFKKLNLFASYNLLERRRWRYRDNTRDNFLNDELRYLEQRTEGVSRDFNNNVRVGFDWDAAKLFSVSGSVLYRPEYDRDRDQGHFQYFDRTRQLSQRIVRTTDEEERSSGFDYTLSLRKRFEKPQRELSFDGTLATSSGEQLSLFSQSTFGGNNLPSAPALLQRNTRANNNQVMVLQADFVEPLKNKGKLEAGLKYTNRYLDGDFVFENREGGSEVWLFDPTLSNRFIYDEHTSAAYANFGTEHKKWSYQAGLRLEHTDLHTEQRTTNQTARQSYTYLFPSAFLNYDLSKAQKMQVNYTRRINRPWVRALNPFVDISDPLNIRYGNPNLRPELINSFELSHLWYGKSTSLTTTAFYRASTDNVTRYRRLRDDGVTEQTFLNLASSYSYGVEMILNQDITPWWKANGNFSYFIATIQGAADIPDVLTQTNRSWIARLNNNFTFKGLDGQLSVNYRSPFIIPQGEILGFFNVDLGVKKDVLKGRGSVNLRVSDIFDTLRFRIRTFGEGFSSYTESKRETRVAYLGFTYRFGRVVQQQKERRERDGGGDTDGDMY
ncbi:outer membrane beta-barrel family protein [Rhabdobacter roseus]|uniref:Outer membrane receptor protein involved in Fe transport n=1 Tax=Rhabdobacter roseus TaxID=1655419 RepID=A0A840TKI5_9BACT|nr:TonB-dependent receptor [Rhabdobacter roseus]MBB5282072.1 outer membrane receptor protein involved in Fe transport [Rhabdobacter roseus]